jgi:hypothetical protein
MQQYMNEDAAWQHLQDLQREAENRRLAALAGGNMSVWAGLRRLAGLAMRRPSRRRPSSA